MNPNQHQVYEFIKSYIQKHGYSPTLMEIAEAIGVRAKSLISRYVHALEEAGLIELVANTRRNIRIKPVPKARIPLIGEIAAGHPIEAIQSAEPIDIVEMLNTPETWFALKVKGDSMIEEGIYDGDFVLCERRHNAFDGEIVVALIDSQEATLKRFYQQTKNKIMLAPANIRLKPLIVAANRVQIQGIYKGLLRLLA